MANHVTGIDIGSYPVKVVIAERSDDPRLPPRILGTGYAESRGLRQGYIVSIPEVSRSVAAAVAQASKAARVKVKRVYLGVGGIGIEEAFSRGETVVERGDSIITSRDLPRAEKVCLDALSPAAKQNRIVIHSIPLRYSVDGTKVLGKTPVDMNGQRVSVEMLFITCLERQSDLKAAVEDAGFEVEMCARPWRRRLSRCQDASASDACCQHRRGNALDMVFETPSRFYKGVPRRPLSNDPRSACGFPRSRTAKRACSALRIRSAK
jgi:cell division protein FtsA